MQMNPQQIQDRINRIEQCVDDAAAALRSAGSAPEPLRQAVSELHDQSLQARHMAQQSSDPSQMTDCIDKLEECGDRAMQACRSAGNKVDQQVQQAVQRAHGEASDLKHQMH